MQKRRLDSLKRMDERYKSLEKKTKDDEEEAAAKAKEPKLSLGAKQEKVRISITISPFTSLSIFAYVTLQFLSPSTVQRQCYRNTNWGEAELHKLHNHSLNQTHSFV